MSWSHWPGYLALGLIVLTALGSASMIGLEVANLNAEKFYLYWPYWLKVLGFTLGQALLSTALSLLVGGCLGLGLANRHIPSRTFLLASMNLCFVLPPLVAVMIIIQSLGQQGWLKQWWRLDISLYGWAGILLCHTWLNAPWVARTLIQTLERIPNYQFKLATQLGLNGLEKARWLYWPTCRPVLKHLGAFIFFLCVSSFTIVLTLGGGPAFSTLEISIYQSIHFDYDPLQAACLALLQGTLNLCMALILWRQQHWLAQPQQITIQYQKPQFITFLTLGFWWCIWIIPLLAFGLNSVAKTWPKVNFELLTQALTAAYYSLSYAAISSFIAIIMALAIIAFATQKTHQLNKTALLLGHFNVIFSSMVSATGLMLIHWHIASVEASPLHWVIWLHALIVLPLAISLLLSPWQHAKKRYQRLIVILNITPRHQWRWVLWPLLRNYLGLAFSLSMLIAMGEVGIPALFGFEHFPTLSVLLLQALNARHFDLGYLLVSLQALLALGLFFLAHQLGKHHVNH